MIEPNQKELFEPRTMARRTDPRTSKQAASQARDLQSKHHSQIIGALAMGLPLAAEQIAAYIQVNSVAVNRRLAELERAGLIERTDLRHKNASGRWAMKWREVTSR